MSRISFNMVYNLRAQLFDQLLKLPSSFFRCKFSGTHCFKDYIHRYSIARHRNRRLAGHNSRWREGSGVNWLHAVQIEATLLFIASAPLLGLIVMFSSSRFRKISRRIQRSMGDVTQVASEVVSGYKLVRTFGGRMQRRNVFSVRAG